MVEIGLFPIQPVQTGRAICRDAGERLVDIMGDRGHQLAQGRQPRGMGELIRVTLSASSARLRSMTSSAIPPSW